MLRISLLGMAHVHANGYANHVVNHKEAEIVSIWDENETRGKAAAEQFGAPWTADLEEATSPAAVDAVVINAETSKHPEVLKAAINNGRHVFTEKALTVTTAEADEIVKLVHQSGIKFMISLPSRTRSEILFMKKVLDEGWLGKITLMRARIAHCAALDKWFSGGSAWFADETLAGGGALFDLGCHTTDVMRWFMGPPKSVIAKLQNFSGAYPIDDNSAAVIEFENGALGILDTAWVHRTGANPYELFGTEGYLSYNAAPGSGLVLQSPNLKVEGMAAQIHPTDLPAALPLPMDQWISAILHDTDMTITVEDGRNLTEMLELIYTAAREGREVSP